MADHPSQNRYPWGLCPEEQLPDFLHVLEREVTHLKNGREVVGTVNDEALASLCGFPNLVLRYVWFTYGLLLRQHSLEPTHLLWTLARMHCYTTWAVLSLLWGEKKTALETQCDRVADLLFTHLNEVRHTKIPVFLIRIILTDVIIIEYHLVDRLQR